MTGRAAGLPVLLAFLFLSLCAFPDSLGASYDPPPAAFTVLHTANGLGELSPCG